VAVWAHPQHTETSGLDASGAPMAKEEVDQMMVFTEVKLTNHTNHPLYLANVLTNATLSDGIHSSYAANIRRLRADLHVAYPNIPVPHNALLYRRWTRRLTQGKRSRAHLFRLSKCRSRIGTRARSWTTPSVSVTSQP
jgi:hypothetical protein